jgi:Ca2+-binding EF-hand superfamily protein
MATRIICGFAFLLMGTACSALSIDSERTVDVRLTLSYDTNRDGIVTRDEVENGLQRDFAVAKIKGGGSPSFDKFAAKTRSAFQMLDRNKDGRLTSDELSL